MKGQILTQADMRSMLPPRLPDSHKGKNGKALLCVGSVPYTGAALLCAAATLRAGAGITTAAVPLSIKTAFSSLPEVCCIPVGDGDGWTEEAQQEAIGLLPDHTAFGIGCGMGSCASEGLLLAALRTKKPVVIDADGLNLLAGFPSILEQDLHENVILTPHPGEMARLLACSVQEVLREPATLAQTAAKAWNCVLLLKGETSFIATRDKLTINRTGNSGLAKGGSGDVLTGLIVGLLAQSVAAFNAACLGAYLLGVSADRAFELLETRLLIARDVLEVIEDSIHGLRDMK